MTRIQKGSVAVIAAVLTVFWAVIAVFGNLAPQVALEAFIFSTALWASAAFVFIHRYGLNLLDGPGQLLAVAVVALPERRRGWGMAMLAELAEVQGRSARWRFALSSAWATLLLPSAASWPLLALAAGVVVAAIVASGPVIGGVMPELEVFAAGFVGVFGALAIATLARSSRGRIPALLPALIGTGAVAGAVAMTVIFLRRDPSAAVHLPPISALFLGAVLAGCLWVAVTAPRPMRANRFMPHLGAGAGLAYAAIFLAMAEAAYHPQTPQALREVIGIAAVLVQLVAPLAALFVAALAASLISRSLRSGLRAGIWSAVVGLPLMYGLWLLFAPPLAVLGAAAGSRLRGRAVR